LPGAPAAFQCSSPKGYEDYLVNSVEDCASKLLFLLEHRDVAENFGRAGQAKIRAQFLLPRLIRDELRLIKNVVGERPT
jgi:trehalose synthase